MRQAWTREQDLALAASWVRGDGIYAAAAHAGHSVSSTRTRASRLELPARPEVRAESGCRVWSAEEKAAFGAALARHTTVAESGNMYVDVAGMVADLDRSGDVIVDMILDYHSDRDPLVIAGGVTPAVDTSLLRTCSCCGRRFWHGATRSLCRAYRSV